jgi:hypothetical protein
LYFLASYFLSADVDYNALCQTCTPENNRNDILVYFEAEKMLQKLKKHNCIFLKKTYVAAFIASSKFFFLSSVETAKGSIAESPNK